MRVSPEQTYHLPSTGSEPIVLRAGGVARHGRCLVSGYCAALLFGMAAPFESLGFLAMYKTDAVGETPRVHGVARSIAAAAAAPALHIVCLSFGSRAWFVRSPSAVSSSCVVALPRFKSESRGAAAITLCSETTAVWPHCGSTCVAAMSATDPKDFSSSKTALELLPFPGENPRQHEAVQWWESTHTRIAAAGLITTAKGGSPPAATRLVDVPLDSLPDLPRDHSNFERRRELRIRTQTQNAANARQRYSLTMEGRTTIFAAIYRSLETTAPMFARELRESCDYARHGVDGGYFDGTLAFRMSYAKLFAAERTKADREFYRAAELLQRSTRLPDGCRPEEFMKKAYAWIYKIRPHLAQGYSDADAAEYLIEMVPKRLAADARRIKAECQREGTYLNLMHLARELEKVIFDDQSAVAIAPALASVDADTAARFDLLALSEMCGMALSAHGAGSPPESMALVGADGTAKWCSRCPHPNGGRCFADPSFEGPLPVGIHLNAERKKAILKAKAENAKKAGVANARVSSPSQKEVDDYKKRRAARGGRGRGKGRDDDSSPAALAEEVVGAAAAVGADEFYGSLRDITEEDFDVAMCVVAIDDAAAYDSPPLSDAPELFWFVVTESDGEPAVRGAVNRRHLDLEPGAACVSFGTDEDRARAYLGAMRDRQASRTPGALPTLETATPSPAPTPAPVDALIPPPLDPPPACTMILGTVTPAPAPAFSRLARPPPSATPSFAVGGAGLAAAASAAGFGEPLGPAAPPPTGEEAEALIHVIAGTPAPAPDIVLKPRVERRVGTPPPTELAPHAADGTPSTPWTCAPPPIVTAAASVTTAARAATPLGA